MKLLYRVTLQFAGIICVFICVHSNPEENNFGWNQKVRYFADPNYRFTTQFYRYSNTEFDHAVDDDRCGDRSYDYKSIVKNTQYGNIRGREIYLCDRPGVPLRERPGQPQALEPKGSIRVFLGIPYAEPPVRRRNGENLQFKVSSFILKSLNQ